MPKFTFEDSSLPQSDRDFSILPENIMDTVFDGVPADRENSENDQAIPDSDKASVTEPSEKEEPDFGKEEPDFGNQKEPDSYEGEEPTFDAPEFDGAEPRFEDGKPIPDAPEFDGDEPHFDAPFSNEEPDSAKKGMILFEMPSKQLTTEGEENVTVERAGENDAPGQSSSFNAKYLLSIAVYLQFAYNNTWTRFVQNDYGVIGKILQGFGEAWENAVKAQCQNFPESGAQSKALAMTWPEKFPTLEYVLVIEDLEELLNELLRMEKFLQSAVKEFTGDAFDYFAGISSVHSHYIKVIIDNFDKLSKAKKEITWICTQCHVTVTGIDAPEECPHCHASTFYFMPMSSFFPYESII